MISAEVRQEVFNRLRVAESEHHTKVLLAIESGSRAWGFASPNSDYDARFIYANRPDWYLSVGLEEKRDVIEYPIVEAISTDGIYARRRACFPSPTQVSWSGSNLLSSTSARAHFTQERWSYFHRSTPLNVASTTTEAWPRPITGAICKVRRCPSRSTSTYCGHCCRCAGWNTTKRLRPLSFRVGWNSLKEIKDWVRRSMICWR